MPSCATSVPNSQPPAPAVSAASAAASAARYTPPVVKWLLNERAALAGEAERLQDECAKLTAALAQLQAKLPEVQRQLSALDATLAAIDKCIAPDAGGVVKAQGRHGKRGSLKAFIHEQLQAAGAVGIDTKELTLRTAAAFRVALLTSEHYSHYRRAIVFPVLRRGREAGILEELVARRGGRTPSVWRWRGHNAAPRLAELRELASKVG